MQSQTVAMMRGEGQVSESPVFIQMQLDGTNCSRLRCVFWDVGPHSRVGDLQLCALASSTPSLAHIMCNLISFLWCLSTARAGYHNVIVPMMEQAPGLGTAHGHKSPTELTNSTVYCGKPVSMVPSFLLSKATVMAPSLELLYRGSICC